MSENKDAAVEADRQSRPAASAGPVEINIDRVLSIADAHANESREDGVRLLDRGGLFAFAQDVLRVAVPVAAQPSVREDVIYLGCARMGIAGASDEEVLSYVRVALRNATPPAAEQASIQQWPSDWADQLNGEYRQGLEDGRKEAQLSGNPVQLVSVQVDRSSNLQGSPVDKSTEMQDQLSAQDREDAV